MSTVTKSQAKLMIINFLRSTREDSEFKFKLRGDTEEANKFIHRMRVELSRMRDVVKDSGRVPKEFKMIVEGIEFLAATNTSIVTLKKQEGKVEAIAEEINEIFEDIAGGAVLKS